MAFTLIIVIFALLTVIGYQLRENVETKRRRAAEEETEQTRQELAEVEDKLSRSYGHVTYRTRGIMPELHKK